MERKVTQNRDSKKGKILITLAIDSLENVAPKTKAKEPPEEGLFLKKQFYRFLKDVRTKTLTVELRKDPKMEPESYKKPLKYCLRGRLWGPLAQRDVARRSVRKTGSPVTNRGPCL